MQGIDTLSARAKWRPYTLEQTLILSCPSITKFWYTKLFKTPTELSKCFYAYTIPFQCRDLVAGFFTSVIFADAPWRQGYEVLKIIKLAPQADSRVCCAGCRELIIVSPWSLASGDSQWVWLPAWIQKVNSLKATPLPYAYVLRAPTSSELRSQGPNHTTMCGRWLPVATSKENGWGALFKKGDVA